MTILSIGSTYTPPPFQQAPAASALPPVRQYRAVCVEAATGTVLECKAFARFGDAHYLTKEWDSLYDYPTQEYWVERSLDGGATWEMYMADEMIGGRPAWTHDDL